MGAIELILFLPHETPLQGNEESVLFYAFI